MPTRGQTSKLFLRSKKIYESGPLQSALVVLISSLLQVVKNKKHFHHKAPEIDNDVINDKNSDSDHSGKEFTSGYGIKAPEEKRTYNGALLSAIIFSAILAIAISISGAK